MSAMDKSHLREDDLRQHILSLCTEWSIKDGGGAFATFTDEEWGGTLEELIGCLDDDDRLTHLLELRVFDVTRELHAVRDHMGGSFSWRLAGGDDKELGSQGLILDEVQFLDRDDSPATREMLAKLDPTKRTYKSMSGGTYRLPMSGAKCIHIRSYLAFDEDGVAGVTDYRIVELIGEGE